MGYHKDLLLSRTAEDERLDRSDGLSPATPAVETVIDACLRTLRDRSPAARAALTAGLDLSGPAAGLRRAIERRCFEVVILISDASSPRSQGVAASPEGRPEHIAYAGRRIAAHTAAQTAARGIPLVVDGQTVGVADVLAEADRWLERFASEELGMKNGEWVSA